MCPIPPPPPPRQALKIKLKNCKQGRMLITHFSYSLEGLACLSGLFSVGPLCLVFRSLPALDSFAEDLQWTQGTVEPRHVFHPKK